MDAYEDLVFELILQPTALDEKLFKKGLNDAENKKMVLGVLKELLQQLSTMIAANKAATSTTATSNNSPEGAPQQQQQPPPNPSDSGRFKKMAFVQLMVLRIGAFLQWKLDEFPSDSPHLQLLMLETLARACDPQLSNLREEPEKRPTNLSKAGVFAQSLYHRWMLRTVPL